MPYPFIDAKMVTQQEPGRQDRQKPFYRFPEIIIGGIEYQVTWFVVAGDFGCKTAAEASSIHNDMMFAVLHRKGIINKLHIFQHHGLTPFAGAFAKTPVVYQHHIIIIPEKILCILCPAFYTPAVSMKIKNQSKWIFHSEVKPVDTNSLLNIEKQFLKGCIVFVNKILPEFFRFKDEFFLHQVNHRHHNNIAGQYVDQGMIQVGEIKIGEDGSTSKLIHAYRTLP